MSTLHYQRPSFQYAPYRPVTPPPVLPSSYEENPMLWTSMTKAQRHAAKERRRAVQPHLARSPSPDLFFQSWTPEITPCRNPLCCMPHHQSQTTSHSPCSQTTSPPTNTPSIGLLTIQVMLCKEKDSRAFRSPVSAQFPRLARSVLQDVIALTHIMLQHIDHVYGKPHLQLSLCIRKSPHGPTTYELTYVSNGPTR